MSKGRSGKRGNRGTIGERTECHPGVLELARSNGTIVRNGWLVTGDMVRQDDEGFVFIAGRKKEMIISGGENIYPLEIERVLYEL